MKRLVLSAILTLIVAVGCTLFTSPTDEGETFSACGTYPAVYIAGQFSPGQAEDFYRELMDAGLVTSPTGRRLLRDSQDPRVTFFRPGEQVVYVRASDRYERIVQVRTDTDRMVTLEDELQGLVGPC